MGAKANQHVQKKCPEQKNVDFSVGTYCIMFLSFLRHSIERKELTMYIFALTHTYVP